MKPNNIKVQYLKWNTQGTYDPKFEKRQLNATWSLWDNVESNRNFQIEFLGSFNTTYFISLIFNTKKSTNKQYLQRSCKIILN